MSFNRYRHPEGTRLPALERNILKYRGFEMLLLLFYVEELRGMIIGATRATDRLIGDPGSKPTTVYKFTRATARLVSDGMLSQEESKEIANLVETRNLIAHELQKMTFDVSRDTWVRQVREIERSGYDDKALDRVRRLRRDLERRMRTKYVCEISLDPLLFQSAERTYNDELKALRKKIDVQLEKRRRGVGQLKHELSLAGTEFERDELHPAHRANMSRNGNLTRRGVEICFRLFDLGKSPMAVAYLMYISAKAARRRYRQWLKLGGRARRRTELSLTR
jgi:hypothetical protein